MILLVPWFALFYDLSVVTYAFDMEVGDLRMMSETQDATLPGETNISLSCMRSERPTQSTSRTAGEAPKASDAGTTFVGSGGAKRRKATGAQELPNSIRSSEVCRLTLRQF